MRRAAFFLSLMLCAGVAAPSQAGGVDLRLGGFYPRGGDTLWSDVCSLYTVEGCRRTGPGSWEYRSLDGDWKGLFGGLEVNAEIWRHLELGVHVDGYGRSLDTAYREYHADGDDIRQTLRFSMVPVGVTLRVLPTAKRQRVVPFAGAGVDAFFYSYEEEGELIDFYDPDLPVYDDRLRSDGVAFGAHAVAGLRVYLNRDFAIVGECRYQWAKHEMGDDFEPNESGEANRIDLGGPSFTLGLHLRF